MHSKLRLLLLALPVVLLGGSMANADEPARASATPDGELYAWVQPAGWMLELPLPYSVGTLAVAGLPGQDAAETWGNDIRWVSDSDDTGDIYSINANRWALAGEDETERSLGLEAACRAMLVDAGASVKASETLELGGRQWLRLCASLPGEPAAAAPYTWYSYAALDGDSVIWLSVHYNDSLSVRSEQWLHNEVLARLRAVTEQSRG